MKHYRWFEFLLVALVVTTSMYAAFSDPQNLSMRWFTRDDAYYYFKVAQNISEGHGSTFDGIHPTNGYHPLWMMVCVPIFALARFDLILPLRVLLMVMGSLSAATAVLFYRLLGKVFTPAVGAIAALYWAFNYDVLVRVYQPGLETGLAVFFVVLLVYKLYDFEMTWRKGQVTNQQLLQLGLVALLTVLSRLDLIFLAGMAGIWVIFRTSPLRYFLPLDIAALVVSVLLAFVIRFSLPAYYKFSDTAAAMVAVSLVIKLSSAYILGLYQPAVITKASKLAARLLIFSMIGSGITAISMLILAKLVQFEAFPRITLIYDFMFTTLFFGVSRFSVLGLSTNLSTHSAQIPPLEYLRRNWKLWLTEAIAYYGIVGGGLALYMLSNKIWFGTFSPVSGQIKRWWGSLPGRVYDGPARESLSFFGINFAGDSNTWHPISTFLGSFAEKSSQLGLSNTLRYIILLSVFALLCYLFLIINKQKTKSAATQLSMVPLFACAWLQVLYYHAFGYSAYKEWYWTSQLVLVVLMLSLLLGLFYQAVRHIRYIHHGLWGFVLGFGLFMVLSFWSAIHARMTYGEWDATAPYDDTAAFLEVHTEPGSIIGLTGGGNAGYFVHDRTVVNMDGLINSYEYFKRLQERKAGEYLAGQGMDYILANPYILNQLPYKGQYQMYMEAMGSKLGGKELFRYHSKQP